MSLLTADLKCKIVQILVQKKVYKGNRFNSFEPWNKPGIKVFDDGLICKNDICYGEKYPSSFFDIWYLNDSEMKRPTFVYFHGGGFIFGDKSNGDPLAEDGSVLKDIVKAGFNLVNANYALAPKYRFPVQIEQVNELMTYLIEHEEELKIDMSRVVLSGGSAGADLAEIYGAAVCNKDYAEELGINPIMNKNNLKVLVIDEAALDTRTFDFNKNMYSMLHCWLGEGSKEYKGKSVLLNAKEHIKDTYIPSWINTSNQESWFIDEAKALNDKLNAIGCEHDLVCFDKKEAVLNHGYMNLKDTNKYASEAFDRMINFVKEHI